MWFGGVFMKNIPQETMQLLKSVKSPDFYDILISAQQQDFYYTNTHDTQVEDVAGLEEFCEMVYFDWKNFLLSRRGAVPEEMKLSIEALKDPRFAPTELFGSAHPYYDFLYQYKDLLGTSYRPVSLQSDETIISAEGDLESFMHVYGWRTNGQKRDAEDVRLYLNLQAKNIPQFATEAYKKCKARNLPFYFKFSLSDKRNDPFLFYSSFEHMAEYVAVIEEIKMEKPYLLEGTEKIGSHLGSLYGYIGFGESPSKEGESYTSVRRSAVSNVSSTMFRTLKRAFPERKLREAFTIVGSPMTFDQTCEFLIKRHLLKCYPQLKKLPDYELLMRDAVAIVTNRIKNAIIMGGSVKNGEIRLTNNISLNLQLDKVDWIVELAAISGKSFQNKTQVRAYAAKHFAYQSSSLMPTPEEKMLHSAVHRALLEGVKEKLDMEEDPDKIEIYEKILDRLDCDFEMMSRTGKALIIIASTRFRQSGQLYLEAKGSKISFADRKLQVYEEFFGREEILGLVEKECMAANISPEHSAFNNDTAKELAEERKTLVIV